MSLLSLQNRTLFSSPPFPYKEAKSVSAKSTNTTMLGLNADVLSNHYPNAGVLHHRADVFYPEVRQHIFVP